MSYDNKKLEASLSHTIQQPMSDKYHGQKNTVYTCNCIIPNVDIANGITLTIIFIYYRYVNNIEIILKKYTSIFLQH